MAEEDWSGSGTEVRAASGSSRIWTLTAKWKEKRGLSEIVKKPKKKSFCSPQTQDC